VERWGFTAPWDARSVASVRAHQNELEAVVYGWIPLDSLTAMPTSLYAGSLTVAAPSATRRLAIVTTFQGDHFHATALRALATDSVARAGAASAIAQWAAVRGYQGIVLDFEDVPRADSAALRLMVESVTQAAHARGLSPVAAALVSGDTLTAPARLFASADRLVVMLYDQHWATSAPGPIADPEWARRVLATRIAEVGGTDRIIAALPTYGYRWRPGLAAEAISLDDARGFSSAAGLALVRDSASATLHAISAGADPWELWVSDGLLVSRLLRVVAEAGVTRVAFWRLGLEDPAIWTLDAPKQ
jgi:spore germination protein YaaH